MSSNDSPSKIPQILLVVGNVEHRGIQGSYCWNGICIDYARPSQRTEFLEKIMIQNDSIIKFKITDNVAPSEFHVTFFSWRQKSKRRVSASAGNENKYSYWYILS